MTAIPCTLTGFAFYPRTDFDVRKSNLVCNYYPPEWDRL